MKTIKLLKILTIAMAFLIVIGFIFVTHKLAEKGTKIKSSSIARSEMVLDFPEKIKEISERYYQGLVNALEITFGENWATEVFKRMGWTREDFIKVGDKYEFRGKKSIKEGDSGKDNRS